MKVMKKSYERRLNQSFFVVECGLTDIRNGYEMKMLEHNKIDGLLPVEIKTGEDNTMYRYNITSLKSLSAMLELKKLNEKELRNIIVEFHKLMYVLPEYLLDEENVMIDSDFIFVDPKDGGLHFCYMFETGRKSREQLRELLSKLMSCINHDDHNAVVLGYQLFKKSQREEFVYSDLLDALNHFVPELPSERNKRPNAGNTDVLSENLTESDNIDYAENLLINREAESDRMDEAKDDKKGKSFRFRDIFGFKSRKPKTISEEKEIIPVNTQEEQWMEYLNEYDERKDEEAEHTVLLSERVKELEAKELHLLKSLNRNIKDIELGFFPFVIGKQERVCDYVIHSGNISRMHLKIDCNEGRYYVRDLNSLNGTKLRGEALQTDKDEEIFENDELDIAGFKFIFY